MAARSKEFNKRDLWSSVIAIPLQEQFKKRAAGAKFDVIIDLNLDCRGGRGAARRKTQRLLREILGAPAAEKALLKNLSEIPQYLFATVTAKTIRELVVRDCSEKLTDDDLKESEHDTAPAAKESPRGAYTLDARVTHNERAIYRIWPDFRLELHITKSVSTVKADAAHRAFYANGDDIVWAVLDSGIERHPHFEKHRNLDVTAPLEHRDFTSENDPHLDRQGHGTHVAGIIGGELSTELPQRVAAGINEYLDEQGRAQQAIDGISTISGMAPRCKILSLRVVDSDGVGNVSNLIAALTYIQEINGYGRRLLIHGINMSLGYPFDPKWFACGQSPLCVEVNRLVRSGVVVVIAAGNAGYTQKTDALSSRAFAAGENLTIKDPGNADLAITVGSTHRNMPHLYGVSYFSSKGPTGDGRLKPDLLAPGEKILSCAAASKLPKASTRNEFVAKAQVSAEQIAWYVPDSGTSMAAPHVSGAIAAFLSVRREFIGYPEEVKKIFLKSATDLGRERYFQGHGLVDLMRAIQSV